MTSCSSIAFYSRFGFLAIMLFTGAAIRGQEPSRTVEEICQFDERGDAKIEINFQLGAKKWAEWKRQYGDHPDIVLRNLKYQFAAAVFDDDFKLEKDEVHRRAVARVTARALASYQSGGQFEIDVVKNMKLVAGSGLEWFFTNTTLEEDGIVNMTDRFKLPAYAYNARLVTGNDYDQLVYSLRVSRSKPKLLLYFGILFLVGAAIMGVLSFRPSSPKAVSTPLPTRLGEQLTRLRRTRRKRKLTNL